MGDLNYRVDANRDAADLLLREGMMEVCGPPHALLRDLAQRRDLCASLLKKTHHIGWRLLMLTANTTQPLRRAHVC